MALYTIMQWDKLRSNVIVQDNLGNLSTFAVPSANQQDQPNFLAYVASICLAIDQGNVAPATNNPSAIDLTVVGQQVQAVQLYTITTWDKNKSNCTVQDPSANVTTIPIPLNCQQDVPTFLAYVQAQCVAIDGGIYTPATLNPAATDLGVVGLQVRGL